MRSSRQWAGWGCLEVKERAGELLTMLMDTKGRMETAVMKVVLGRAGTRNKLW